MYILVYHIRVFFLFVCIFLDIFLTRLMAIDKFFSLGMLTFTTYHKQLCAVHYVGIPGPSHRNAKNLGYFSTPKHPLVYDLEVN